MSYHVQPHIRLHRVDPVLLLDLTSTSLVTRTLRGGPWGWLLLRGRRNPGLNPLYRVSDSYGE